MWLIRLDDIHLLHSNLNHAQLNWRRNQQKRVEAEAKGWQRHGLIRSTVLWTTTFLPNGLCIHRWLGLRSVWPWRWKCIQSTNDRTWSTAYRIYLNWNVYDYVFDICFIVHLHLIRGSRHPICYMARFLECHWNPARR